jgi:hypothetical protein
MNRAEWAGRPDTKLLDSGCRLSANRFIPDMSEKSDFHLDVPRIIEVHSLPWMSKWADGEVIDCEAVDKRFVICGRPTAGLRSATL